MSPVRSLLSIELQGSCAVSPEQCQLRQASLWGSLVLTPNCTRGEQEAEGRGFRTPLGTCTGSVYPPQCQPSPTFLASPEVGLKFAANPSPGLGWAELSPSWGRSTPKPAQAAGSGLKLSPSQCQWHRCSWVPSGGFTLAPTPLLEVPLPSPVPPDEGKPSPHAAGGGSSALGTPSLP